MKQLWDDFKDARTVVLVVVLFVFVYSAFIAYHDYVALGQYIALLTVTVAGLFVIYKYYDAKNRIIAVVYLVLMFGIGIFAYHRQGLRYDAYDISYDLAFTNLEYRGERAVQIGVCLLNPNDFPVSVRVSSMTVNIGDKSGSFSSSDDERVIEVGRLSSNSYKFSDPIVLPSDQKPFTGIPEKELSGVLRVDIQYGRTATTLNKALNVDKDIYLIRDYNLMVQGVSSTGNRGAAPNTYGAVTREKPWRCERI